MKIRHLKIFESFKDHIFETVTLPLKKQYSGYYYAKSGSVEIRVIKDGKNKWSGYVEDHTLPDGEFELYKCYGENKKQVVNQLIYFLQNYKDWGIKKLNL